MDLWRATFLEYAIIQGGVVVKVDSIGAVRSSANIPTVGVGEKDRSEAPNDKRALRVSQENAGLNTRKSSASIGEQQLIVAIEHANKALKGADKRFEFSIHEGTKEIMVKVINDETDEIIREIPPEKILDMVAKIWELAGLMVDRKI